MARNIHYKKADEEALTILAWQQCKTFEQLVLDISRDYVDSHPIQNQPITKIKSLKVE